ncbi:unnamed protein product [Rhizopus stolonifer]
MSFPDQGTRKAKYRGNCKFMIFRKEEILIFWGGGEKLKEHLKSNCKIHVLPESKAFDKQCSMKGCHDVDSRIGPVLCEGCNGGYCLKHRHPSTHQCESLFADEKKKLERKLAAQEKVAKTLKLSSNITKQTTRTVVPAKSKTGGMVELMKMKSQAKGDSSVPVASRIFLYVQCPKLSNMDSISVYFDKKNSVGRALDTLANMCKIINKNNTVSATDPERLYLYKCPEMTSLDNSVTLEKVLKNLDTILLERQAVLMLSE